MALRMGVLGTRDAIFGLFGPLTCVHTLHAQLGTENAKTGDTIGWP